MDVARAPVGIVPLVFASDDLPELTPPVDPEQLVPELLRLGYTGAALSRVLPSPERLRVLRRERGFRVAEAYAALPSTIEGPTPEARGMALERLDALHEVEGEVLIYSYHLAPGREERAGRASAPGVPTWSDEAWGRAISLMHEVAARAKDLGHPLAYHPHVGTFVETPAEVERLMVETDPDLVGLCLDVGHCTVGGGDPVHTIRQFHDRLIHLHFKDVDAQVLGQLRAGAFTGFLDAIRARLFTELGGGVLDSSAIACELAAIGYRGWIMCEQDSTWRPSSESAAISRSVLEFVLRSAAVQTT